MKRLCLILVAALLLWGCAARGPLERISEEVGLDVTAGEILSYEDSHGGFHGDGETVVQIAVSGLTLPKDSHWHSLPLTPNVYAAVYGAPLYGFDSMGPLFPEGSVPEVKNGFWYFCDRHTDASDTADDRDLHSRSSWNFTVAVYDGDSGTLYYLELDT